MSFQWNEIQRSWLFELPSPYSKEEIVNAFNQVEEKLGSEFFDKYNWIRGNYIVTLIVDLAEILEETEKGRCTLPYNGEIMRNIRRNNLHSASILIRLAAHYLRHDVLVEFEPTLLISGRRKQPDLRVNLNGKWVYIEESKFNISKHQKYIDSMSIRVSKVTETVNSNLNIEVSLLKDRPSLREIREIVDKTRTLCSLPNQPQEFTMDDLAQICTYQKGQEKPSIEERRPALCMASLRVAKGIECHFNICVPFTDVRIGKILKKCTQLSPNEHNMIILDLSFSGNLEEWSEVISRVLEPRKYRMIGAVLLIQKSQYIDLFKVNTKLFCHPNPSRPLPKEFMQLTHDYFEQFPEFQYIRSIKNK